MSGFLGDHFSSICVFDANAGLGHLRELRRLREGEPRILCWITAVFGARPSQGHT